MLARQAKILSDNHVDDLLVYASASRQPKRNRLIVLLSVKAGLRAGEIAKLSWDMILGPDGEIASWLELRNQAAKGRAGRRIPLHPDLRQALVAWRAVTVADGPVVTSERCGPMTAASIVL